MTIRVPILLGAVAIQLLLLLLPRVLTPCGAALDRHAAAGTFLGYERIVNAAQLVNLVNSRSVVSVLLDERLKSHVAKEINKKNTKVNMKRQA